MACRRVRLLRRSPLTNKMLRRVAARSPLHASKLKLLHTSAAATPDDQDGIRYLVIDGYVKTGRDVLEAGGATTAGQLYANMLVKATKRSVDRSASYDLIYPADPGFVAPDLSKYHGVGWSGSSLAVHERDDPSVVQMMRLARQSFAHGVPQFGSCFGLQLAVATAGGVVRKNKWGKELGVARRIRLNAAGRAHPMYEGKPSVFDAFSSHKDEVRVIQPGGLQLASNSFTTVQSVCLRYLQGEFWGLQYHPEYDLHEMARLLHCRRKMNSKLGFFTDLEDADRFVDLMEELAADPTRKDLAWQIGYDKDVLDEDLRTCEVKNFVKHLVLPYYMQWQQQSRDKDCKIVLDVPCQQEVA
ncbi:Glutamine amidotransferase class-I [Phytophthora infestans]|uniref:Glutamine amidotransferase class-I n=1 Tax=Phytophthora infestans TaxID=4787 RepID=A0A8S9TZA6_PHYIN|nr:Glutamine amidotransferase class-I [Phytophthora infestans]